ncbi:MAG: beta-ketoacyl-ACP synthase I [Pseudomonadota bacterium]
MRRVVVTGMGIVSSIGNNRGEVAEALRAGRSGIERNEEQVEMGFRSHVAGTLKVDIEAHVDRKLRRFMGDGAAYNYIAMKEAVQDAGLEPEEISNERVGLVVGAGGTSTRDMTAAYQIAKDRGVKRIGPFMVPRIMSNTNSATLSVPFKIKGVSYTMSSACSTSAHCIGHGMELIQLGKQDMIFAGGGEELAWTASMLFDAMPALSSRFNEEPTKASRPFDRDRDGFVISGGGGLVVLEELEHARARGAKIYAELVGYGATSDGYDMVQPSGEGAERCMRLALQTIGNTPVDYINTHGTSTPIGDVAELKAIRNVFGEALPKIASTKSLTGHALGAAGVNEAIYSLIMMEEGFLAASANIDNADPEAEGMPLLRQSESGQQINCVLSNSFGFGGTNASLAFKRFEA